MVSTKHSARDEFGTSERLSQRAWDERYRAGETGWDLGRAAPPLERWFLENSPKGMNVVVPGCGRGYEVRLLQALGAQAIVGVDISQWVLEEARRLTGDPGTRVRWFQGDVRHLSKVVSEPVDWVVEHTCFCALSPADRETYLDEVRKVLRPGGLFVGLFYVDFNNPDGPPFGIPQRDLRILLEARFAVKRWESRPKDSISVRQNKEALTVMERV